MRMVLVAASVAMVLPAVAELTPPEPGDVRLEGIVGVSAERCISARVRSDWAKGALYDEAVESFRTHADDKGEYGGWQNEYWGKTMLSMAGAAAYEGDAALAGDSSWTLAFDLSPRVVEAVSRGERLLPPSPQGHDFSDVAAFTVRCMELHAPEMAGLCRIAPAVRVMRGPIYLAKGRLAGTSRGDTFATFCYENGGAGWKTELVPLRDTLDTAGVPRAWRLTMARGAEEKEFAVSDFASVSNVDDPDNWFSIWF